jgi:hypothetical protein
VFFWDVSFICEGRPLVERNSDGIESLVHNCVGYTKSFGKSFEVLHASVYTFAADREAAFS